MHPCSSYRKVFMGYDESSVKRRRKKQHGPSIVFPNARPARLFQNVFEIMLPMMDCRFAHRLRKVAKPTKKIWADPLTQLFRVVVWLIMPDESLQDTNTPTHTHAHTHQVEGEKASCFLPSASQVEQELRRRAQLERKQICSVVNIPTLAITHIRNRYYRGKTTND